ncbi:hypothetical protein [Kitasatospora sp. NPDC094011]|uniref:hypothetical protein n=1 Tax=Kitasatospora sp. NPDC094011 TaxID=3364090 RepID=UPI003822DAE5
MDLEFKGIDPDTPNGGSPTVWLEHERREIVFQGLRPDEEMNDKISTTEWVDGHTIGIPDHENVTRVPLRMAAIIRKALDDAERAGLLDPAERS